MKRPTIIDIRKDGPHVVPDPGTTLVHHYDPQLLAQLAQSNAKEPDPLFKAGLCSGLGAFFDALITKGYTPEVANELLWAAYRNLKAV